MLPQHLSHAGSSSRSIVETETHRDLHVNPDGAVEEWIAVIRREVEEIVSAGYRVTRIRIHLHLSVRRLLSPHREAIERPALEPKDRFSADRHDPRARYRLRAFGPEALRDEPAAIPA